MWRAWQNRKGITPGGDKGKPVLIKWIHRLRGEGEEEERKGSIPQDSWVTRSGALELVEVDRAENYILYMVDFGNEEATPEGVSFE